MPTLAAQAYKHNVGLPTMYPKNNLSYVGNFMHDVGRPSGRLRSGSHH